MEDKWKELFRENKEKIQEEFSLPKGHENRFLDKLNLQKTKAIKPRMNYWKVAAIMVPLLMLSAYYFLEFAPSLSSEKETKMNLSEYSHDLKEADNHLTYIVQQKVEEVKSMETPENQKLIDDSLSELHTLQTDYDRLLIDIKQSGGNPQVVRSLLMNLQLQVELLENVLSQIETIQEFKNNHNETI